LIEKSGLVRTQRTEHDQLILVDPFEDEDVEEIRPRTDPPKLLTRRSKEMEEYYSLILIESIITLHWLWQIFLM
jgi:hypothetical protein